MPDDRAIGTSGRAGRSTAGARRSAGHPGGMALGVGVGGAIAALTLILVSAAAGAETWSAAGLSFRVAQGDARLLAVSGSGSRADPIVMVEEITGLGPATIVIENARRGRQSSPGSGGHLLLSMVTVIANRGPWRWSGFDLELRTSQGRPSVYTDGLSFDQPRAVRGNALADRFAHTAQQDEPFDQIRFDGGRVDPSERLRLEFAIVDINGRAAFHLVQHPIVLLAGRDPDATTDLAEIGSTAAGAWPGG